MKRTNDSLIIAAGLILLSHFTHANLASAQSSCGSAHPEYCSQFISQNVPSSLNPCEIIFVTITMKNTGTKVWTWQNPSTGLLSTRLGAISSGNSWGLSRFDIYSPTQVSPGSNHDFRFEITAPADAGQYDFQWQMLLEGVEWFGEKTPNAIIAVTSSVPQCAVPNPPPADETTEDTTLPPAGGKPFSVQPVTAPPTQGLPTDLGQLIQQIFSWSLLVLGVAVFVSFFYAGFLYLTAAGNTANVGEAQKKMTNAVFGAILLLSSYLILYTINPNFVKNTFNLPGLKTGSPTTTTPPGGVVPPPADALTKHPDQSAQVASIKTQLVSQGVDISGDCGAFEITKRVASLLSNSGAGLLSKPGGANCQGYAVAIIAYSDGYIYDILNDAGNANVPQWIPDACGPLGGNGTCSDRYRPAIP